MPERFSDLYHSKCNVLLDAVTTLWPVFLYMKGGKEYMMRAHFGLPSVESEEAEAKRPITVNFEIPYFTVSGIQVGPFTYIAQFGSVLLPCWFVVFFFYLCHSV